MNNYKNLTAKGMRQQRKVWIDKYADDVLDMANIVLDALGNSVREGHDTHRVLVTDKFLLMRSEIIGKQAEKSGTLYRLLIDPVIEENPFDIKGWLYQPMYFLVGCDELGTLDYSNGRKAEYHITPGEWIHEIKKLMPKAERILTNTKEKIDKLESEVLYINMALEIAKEIKI